MKKLIFILVLASFFSCNSSTSSKKTTYTVTDWSAQVPTNLRTWDQASQWVKMVIFKDSVSKVWKLNSNGDTVWTYPVISDTFFLLRTADKNLPLRDTSGAVKIDPNTKEPLFYLSWNNPQPVPKDVITPGKPIPSRFLPFMNQSIPTSDSIKDIHMVNGKIQDTTKSPKKTPLTVK